MIDFNSYKKLQMVAPIIRGIPFGNNDRVLVLIALQEQATVPPYVVLRAKINSNLISANVSFSDFDLLEKDDTVVSFALFKKQPL